MLSHRVMLSNMLNNCQMAFKPTSPAYISASGNMDILVFHILSTLPVIALLNSSYPSGIL